MRTNFERFQDRQIEAKALKISAYFTQDPRLRAERPPRGRVGT